MWPWNKGNPGRKQLPLDNGKCHADRCLFSRLHKKRSYQIIYILNDFRKRMQDRIHTLKYA